VLLCFKYVEGYFRVIGLCVPTLVPGLFVDGYKVLPAALEGELLLLQMSHGMARNLLIAQVPPRDRRIEERGAPIRSVVALVTLPQVAEGGVMPKSEQG